MSKDHVFQKTVLNDATITDCAMARATFDDVNLADARFTNVNLSGAKLEDVNLSNVAIDNANIDGLTIFGHDIQALIRAEILRRKAAGAKTNRSTPRATVVPVLTYPDVRAAVAWLSGAFGFIERVRIGEAHRAQMIAGDGAVIVADAGHGRHAPSRDGVTHSIRVRVADAAAHFRHARQYGASILSEPTDQPYGEREYTVEDLAGHLWTFAETIANVAPEDWGGVTVTP